MDLSEPVIDEWMKEDEWNLHLLKWITRWAPDSVFTFFAVELKKKIVYYLKYVWCCPWHCWGMQNIDTTWFLISGYFLIEEKD